MALTQAANRQRFFFQQQSTNACAQPRGPLQVRTRVLVQNRHGRLWDRSGRITAVLPHNSYYVSLDGSRRVTQRTRAHIKPISLFPIRAEDVCIGRQPLSVATEALRPGTQPGVVPVPVATEEYPIAKIEALEPAASTEDTNKVDHIDEVKCPVNNPSPRIHSASLVIRRHRGAAPSGSALQPAQRAQEPFPVAPTISG